MTTKIIAENILQPEHFISATDQAGGYIGQPIPDDGNTGSFTLLSSGNIADTVYSGTATGDGAVGGTTVVDSMLAVYGDDFWIGATIEITSGDYDGETAAITDFAQATGTLTFAALSGQIVTGVTFTLTLSYASREFEVELVSSGDAGAATFKWSHDGGTTFFGKNALWQADWIGKTQVHAAYTGTAKVVGCKTANYLLVAHDGVVYASANNGTTWAAHGTYDHTGVGVTECMTVLSSGRVLLGSTTDVLYSDDEGVTFALLTSFNFVSVIELPSGNLIGVDTYTDHLTVYVSSNGGSTWVGSGASPGDSGNQYTPTMIINRSGYVICAFMTPEYAAGGEIWCGISTDGGATWSSDIQIMDLTSSANLYKPCLFSDTDGVVYCTALSDDGETVFLSRSTDGGETWTYDSYIELHDDAAEALSNGYLFAGNGKVVCAIGEATGNTVSVVSRGMSEVFDATGFPVPVGTPASLACNVDVTFYGGGGITGDKWTFTPQYSWAMSNIISGSPSKPFRSTADSIDCAIVIDLGQYNRHRATGLGLFGCNVRDLKFQMNATDSWATPSVDETITFDVATGTVDAVSGNMVQDTAFLANYKDHHFSNKGKPERFFLRATSGIDDGETWEILDNVDGWFILNTETSQSMAASDTFAVFTSSMSDTFTGGNYRFLRILIETQTTADGFYQIGSMIAGMAMDLTKSWRVGFGKNHAYNIDLMATPAGGLIPIKKSNRRRVFTVRWDSDVDTRQEVVALADTLEGRSLCLIPNISTPGDCYLVKFSGDINHQHRFSTDRFDITVTFQEVI